MNAHPDLATVNYCYQCGRHVGKAADKCWYCGAPTQREIRPPRRCPYCGEAVRKEALKCRHCGEFIDGRPRETNIPHQIVFVVDRTLLPGAAGRDLRLLAGQPVPPELARMLGPRTVSAIEQNQPAMLDDPRVRALPAPENVVDIEPEEEPEGPRTGREIVVSPAESRLPAAPRPPLPVPVRTGLAIGRGLAMAGKWLMTRPSQGSANKPDGPIEAEATDPYRICAKCGTEMLRSDNFCYHCGIQYRQMVADQRFDAGLLPAGVRDIYVMIVLCVASIAVLGYFDFPIMPGWAEPALAGVSALLCVWAFFRRRRIFNQLISIIMLLATAAVYLAVWLNLL